MKKTAHPLVKSAVILTLAGLIARTAGFFYKIFLASLIGAEGIGIYQMVFPVYILCVSLASSGIQTAISRFTAEKLSSGNQKDARRLFLTGLSMGVLLAGIMALLLFSLAKPISVGLLGEERCIPLLRLMAIAIPFETIHACTNGYFLGQQRSSFPAWSQLAEQTVRIAATWLLWQIFLQKQIAPSPVLAAGGLLAAEMTVALLSVTVLTFCKKPGKPSGQTAPSEESRKKTLRQYIRSISAMAAPITANRLLLNLLQSGEAILIPARLELFYGNSSDALSVYGIFTGMALPLIMFPNAITGSFSMVLLPSVSEAHALKNDKKIAATIQSSLLLCLTLGIVCTAMFLLFGPAMGNLLYHSDQVGSYLTTLAWICPFLYLNTTNNSILHGLGKTTKVFFYNLAGLTLRLLAAAFLVPVLGICGCLIGLLSSQLLTALLGIRELKRTVNFSFSPAKGILFPSCGCLLATGCLKLLQRLFPVLALQDHWFCVLLSGGIWACILLLFLV